MGSWGCPHDLNGICQNVNERDCDPGMKGCVLYGRVIFSNPAKNPPAKSAAQIKAESPQPDDPRPSREKSGAESE